MANKVWINIIGPSATTRLDGHRTDECLLFWDFKNETITIHKNDNKYLIKNNNNCLLWYKRYHTHRCP